MPFVVAEVHVEPAYQELIPTFEFISNNETWNPPVPPHVEEQHH